MYDPKTLTSGRSRPSTFTTNSSYGYRKSDSGFSASGSELDSTPKMSLPLRYDPRDSVESFAQRNFSDCKLPISGNNVSCNGVYMVRNVSGNFDYSPDSFSSIEAMFEMCKRKHALKQETVKQTEAVKEAEKDIQICENAIDSLTTRVEALEQFRKSVDEMRRNFQQVMSFFSAEELESQPGFQAQVYAGKNFSSTINSLATKINRLRKGKFVSYASYFSSVLAALLALSGVCQYLVSETPLGLYSEIVPVCYAELSASGDPRTQKVRTSRVI